MLLTLQKPATTTHMEQTRKMVFLSNVTMNYIGNKQIRRTDPSLWKYAYIFNKHFIISVCTLQSVYVEFLCISIIF